MIPTIGYRIVFFHRNRAMSVDVASYPLAVVYCGICGMPPDLCEYGSSFEACKPWLRANAPNCLPKEKAATASAEGAALSASSGGGTVDSAARGESASAAPGGSGAAADALADAVVSLSVSESGGGTVDGEATKKAAKTAKPAALPKVYVEVNERGRKKQITTISGLDAYCPKLKDAASALGKKFGAGASVTKSTSNPNVMEIDVQVRGDLTCLCAPMHEFTPPPTPHRPPP